MDDKERIEELKKKWKVSSFEEFTKKIESGKIDVDITGDFEYEDDWLEWEYLEDKLKQKVRVKA
ncbi:MAG: hypothetical protein ABH874_02120 [Methanobacteriota archaeon]